MSHNDETYGELMGTAVLPVAVSIVAAAPLPIEDRPTRAWATGQLPLVAGAPPVQIGGAHPARVRLFVKARGAEVFVGSAVQTATPLSGYPIAITDGEVEISSRHEVYASSAGAGVACWRAEYLDG